LYTCIQLRQKETLSRLDWDILAVLHEEGEMLVSDLRGILECTSDDVENAIVRLSMVEGLSLYEVGAKKSRAIGIEHCSFKLKPCSFRSKEVVLFGKRRIIFRSLRDASKKLQKDKRTLLKLIDEGQTLIYQGEVYFIDELYRG